MDNELKNYLIKKGISDNDKIFIKSAEIDVILTISAFDSSDIKLKDLLAQSWQKIIESDVSDTDKAFINNSSWGRQYPWGVFKNIKISGIAKNDNEQHIRNYIRRVWFFTFIAQNYNQVKAEDLYKNILNVQKNDFYSKNNKKNKENVLKDLIDQYINNSTISGELCNKLWTQIAQNYLVKLEDIFEKAKEQLLIKNSKHSSWLKIFADISANSETNNKKNDNNIKTDEQVVESADVNTEDNSSEIKDNSVPETQESVDEKTIEPSTTMDNEETKEEEKEQTNSPLPDESNIISAESSEQPETMDTSAKEDIQEEVKELIKHKEKEPPENISEKFEENLNALYDLSRQISDSSKQKGIENLIKTLNTKEYSNLLDQIYFATQNTSENRDFFTTAAILIKNALQEYDFCFEFYPNEPMGFCIGAPSDDDIEYISRNYRWKNDSILYKNLYICAPGIMNRKTKVFVYPPLVEVK